MAVASYKPVVQSSVAVLLLAVAGSTTITALLGLGNLKAYAAVAGAVVCACAAYFSNNPRLFSLWMLMLTIPFDLSKRFGPVILKMGGESAFRIELSDPFLLVLAGYLAFDIARERIPGIRVPKVIIPYFLIMVMGIVAGIAGNWHLTSFQEVFRMTKVTFLFIVICNELRTIDRFVQCAAAISASVIIQAAVGLVQYATGKRLGLQSLGETSAATIEQLATSSVQSETVFRISAFLVHPNVFGIFLAALIPLAFAFLLLRVNPLYKLLFALPALMGLPALIGTLSRSGWLSFAVAMPLLVTLLFFHPKLQRQALLVMLAGALALALVLALYAGPISRRILSSQEGAVLGREEYNRDAIRMISAYPWFGAGLNCYVFAVPPFTIYGARSANDIYQGWIPAVHNIYLLWFAETGVVGFAIHLILLFMVIRHGISNLRVRNVVLFALNAGCLATIVAFMVDGLFSFSLRINSICRIFWVIAGIIMAIRYWRLTEETKTVTLQLESARDLPEAVATPIGGQGLWTNPLLP